MADPFETRLAAMFDEVPDAPDTSAFLVALEARIDRRRSRRRSIGLALAGGAALAASIGIGATGYAQRAGELAASAGARVGALLPQLGSPDLQTGVGWSILGLAAFALAAGASRLAEDA